MAFRSFPRLRNLVTAALNVLRFDCEAHQNISTYRSYLSCRMWKDIACVERTQLLFPF